MAMRTTKRSSAARRRALELLADYGFEFCAEGPMLASKGGNTAAENRPNCRDDLPASDVGAIAHVHRPAGPEKPAYER
jgi:hypothetical protein